jgi:hypothetical protein
MSLNYCENMSKELTSRTGNMERPRYSLGVASMLWAVLGRKQGRLLIDAASSPRTIMSTAPTAPSTSTSQSNFASIFNASLESYKRKTKKDLASHPLLPSLQSCESPEAVLTVLRDQVPAFNQSQICADDGLTKWVTPTVNVLYSFSGTIGQGAGLVNIKTFRRGEFLLKCLLSGIPTGKCNLRRDRCSPFGQCPTPFPCATYFDTEPRRLKMRALAKTSLSKSLTALNISSSGLRYILAYHRLWL